MNILNSVKFKLDKKLVGLVTDFIAKEGEYTQAKFQKMQFADEDDRAFYELYKSGYVDYLITGNKRHFPNDKGIITAR